MTYFDYEKAKLKIKGCNTLPELIDFISEDEVEGISLADSVWESQCLEHGDRELVAELVNRAYELGKAEKNTKK